MSEKEFTSGQLAAIVGMSPASLRTWQERGHVEFARPEDGKWWKYDEVSGLRVAVMLKLTTLGISPALASIVVEAQTPVIVGHNDRRFLAVAMRPGLPGVESGGYAFSSSRNFADFQFAQNWNHADWFDDEARMRGEFDTSALTDIPPVMFILDLRQICGAVKRRMDNSEQSQYEREIREICTLAATGTPELAEDFILHRKSKREVMDYFLKSRKS
jgi:hypothetical protein